MRKITVEMLRAAIGRRNWTKDNTCVVIREKGEVSVFLHRNLIYRTENGKELFNHCGWPTVTTKERLNAFLSPKDKIYQKDGEWFWQGGRKFIYGWNERKINRVE